MKFISSLILGMSLFSIHASAALDNCIVCDLDNTIRQRINYKDEKLFDALQAKGRVFEVKYGNEKTGFFIFPGAQELILASLKLSPDYKVKFFSSSQQEEVEQFLMAFLLFFMTEDEYKIYRQAGHLDAYGDLFIFNTTVDDRTGRGPYIHSPDRSINIDGRRAFIGSGKKELEKINCNPATSVLIDDDYSYVYKGQDQNSLFVSPDFKVDTHIRDKLEFSNLNDWYSYHHLVSAAGILWTAWEESKATPSILPLALSKIQKTPDGKTYDYFNNSKNPYFLEKGLKVLHEINPKLELEPKPRN